MIKISKYKRDSNTSYTLGIYPTIDVLLNNPKIVKRVVVSENEKSSIGIIKIINLCNKNNIEVEENNRIINYISPKENIYAIAEFTKFSTSLTDGNHIVLVNPSNPGNVGTIIRSMLGMDFKNIVLIRPCVDVFLPDVIRASMGSIFSINFKYYDSIEDYTKEYRNNLYYFSLGATTKINTVSFKDPFSLVFGNEASGLIEKDLPLGEFVKIPMSDKIDSYNLAVSVVLSMYQCYLNKI